MCTAVAVTRFVAVSAAHCLRQHITMTADDCVQRKDEDEDADAEHKDLEGVKACVEVDLGDAHGAKEVRVQL
jgi:hypothetical protein